MNEILYKQEDEDRKVAEESAKYGDNNVTLNQESIVSMALDIEGIIAKQKIRDWARNDDVNKDIENDIDDYLFGMRDKNGITLSTNDMDAIMSGCIGIAHKLAGS